MATQIRKRPKAKPKPRPAAKKPAAPTPAAADTPVQPWDRQPAETTPAYDAFRNYLYMGPARSTEKVARQLAKSKTLMTRWSGRHGWVARVQAFEAHQAREADAEFMAANRERARRHAELAAMQLEAASVPARELMRRLQANPEFVEKLPAAELVRLAATMGRTYKQLVVTERLARDMTTENLGGHDGGPLGSAAQRAAAMSDDELDEKLLGAGVDGYRLGLEDAGR